MAEFHHSEITLRKVSPPNRLLPASNTTILRHFKCHAAAPSAPAPVRVAGIDDWSWRKGWTYGTIIVDIEQRQIVDLLADRSSDAPARWLEQHPEVEVILPRPLRSVCAGRT